MAKSIGIDLGTTNSVGAVKKIHTEVIKNAEGELLTPSCVTFQKKKFSLFSPSFVVGKHALEWLKQDPENTIVAVKRLMGRSFHDKEVEKILSERKLRYKIGRHSKGTENSLAIMLGGKEFKPEDISAKIVEKIRRDAEKALADKVEFAVITVPAYFNDKQKHATRTAAALAGLKVLRLLPEPTAAAISFGVDNIKGDEAQTVLIFDFGGGTFDLSVLTISGGQFIEQGKGGDMWLGGEDIDRMIANYVLEETAKENQIDDIKSLIEEQDPQKKSLFLGELKEKVEKAKIRLSSEEEACIEILGVLKDSDGDNIDLDVELTRGQFEKIIAPMVDSTINLVRKILQDIHYTPELLDRVLLVGGSSRIPRVVEAMRETFGVDKVFLHERPMLAIAEGAAILSHRLADTYECSQCGQIVGQSDKLCGKCGFDLEKFTIEEGVLDIVHSAAHDYFICLENNERHLFVEKNTPLPCEKTEVFKLVHSEQQLVHMKFFNVVNEEEESIGDLWLGIDKEDGDEPSLKRETSSVEITLAIDENNLVEAFASLKERPGVKLSKTLSRGMADEKLFLDLEETINEANRKKYSEYVMTDLLHRSLSTIKEIHNVIDRETGEAKEPIFQRAKLKIEKARKMAANAQTSKPVIFWGVQALAKFGAAISPNGKKEIRAKIKKLEEMDENGTYEENVKAQDELHDTYDKNLGVVNELMEIEKAAAYCMESDPAKAPKFSRALEDIIKAVEKGDPKKAATIIEEVIPEALKITAKMDSKTGVIHKDIKK